MRKFTLFCVLLFFAVLAVLVIFFPIEVHGQTDNTIHVKQFGGITVAQKIANAMATCPASSAGPCILVLDPSLAIYAQGAFPTLCGNCSLWDFTHGAPGGGTSIPGLSSDGSNGIAVSQKITGQGLYIGSNNVWFTNLVRTQSSLDGSGNLIPMGNDLALHARGAADMINSADVVSLTSSTAVSAGSHTITLSASPAANFYIGASLTIDRWTSNQETIAVNSWSFGSGNTITATFANSHSGTFTVDQWGAEDSYGWIWRYRDQATSNVLFQTTEIRSGSNQGYVTSDASGNYTFRYDPSSKQRQFFGDATNGMVYFGSNGGTGTCANWAWENNFVDQVNKLYLNCSSGLLTGIGAAQFAGYQVGSNVVIPSTATLPYMGSKVISGTGAPTDPCSSTVNTLAVEINATPTAYQCSNATGSYAWHSFGVNTLPHCDDGVTTGSTVTCTEVIAAPGFKSTSTTTGPGYFDMPFNSGNNPAPPANSAGWHGPSTTGGASYAWFMPQNTVAGVLHIGASTTIAGVNGAQVTPGAVALSDLAAQGADTIDMNATGGSAVPNAVAMPTCTAGADLYNTSTHSWSCVSTGGSGSAVSPFSACLDPASCWQFIDDFDAGTSSLFGRMLWDPIGTGNTTTYIANQGANAIGVVNMAATNVSADFAGLILNQGGNGSFLGTMANYTSGGIKVRVKLAQTTNTNFFIGFVNVNSGHGEGTTNYVGVAYNVGKSDTGWMCVVNNGTATRTAIAGTLDTNWHDLVINWTSAKTVQCSVDGGAYTTLATTNFPTDTNETQEMVIDNNTTANAVSFQIDYWAQQLTGLGR